MSILQAAKLDTFHLRYQWLKRTLKERSADQTTIFPASWKVQEALAERFCQETRCVFRRNRVRHLCVPWVT